VAWTDKENVQNISCYGIYVKHSAVYTILVNNYPQCSCICVSVGSTVVLRSIGMHGFLVIISAQV
jgi:hypothetical protein